MSFQLKKLFNLYHTSPIKVITCLVFCLRFHVSKVWETERERKRNALQGVWSGAVSRVYRTVVLRHSRRSFNPRVHKYRNEGFSRSLNSYFQGGNEVSMLPNSTSLTLIPKISLSMASPSSGTLRPSLFLSLLFLPLFVVFINVADIKIV